MNIKPKDFYIFIVSDGWANFEFTTLKEAREFIKKAVSDGDDIEDFYLEGRMRFGAE
jgi:hypothetical protein